MSSSGPSPSAVPMGVVRLSERDWDISFSIEWAIYYRLFTPASPSFTIEPKPGIEYSTAPFLLGFLTNSRCELRELPENNNMTTDLCGWRYATYQMLNKMESVLFGSLLTFIKQNTR